MVNWEAWAKCTHMSRREQSASGHCCGWSRWGLAGCSRLLSLAASSPSFPSSSCGSRCTTGSSHRFPVWPPCQTKTWQNFSKADANMTSAPILSGACKHSNGWYKGDFHKTSTVPGYDSLFTFMFEFFLRPIFSGMIFQPPSPLPACLNTQQAQLKTAALYWHNRFPVFAGASWSLHLRGRLISPLLNHSILPCNSITSRHTREIEPSVLSFSLHSGTQQSMKVCKRHAPYETWES